MFIGTLVGMRELEEKNRVDLLSIISAMRQDRGGMVQTKDQYVFLHKVRDHIAVVGVDILLKRRFYTTML